MGDYQKLYYDRYANQKGVMDLSGYKKKSKIYSHIYGPTFQSLDRSSRVIDIGCGNGNFLYWLKDIGFTDLHGIDLAPELIDQGKKVGLENIQVADAFEYLAQAEQKFSVIVLRDIIEHIPKAKIPGFLKLINDSLEPGGLIILQTPNASSMFFGHVRYGDFTHEVAFTDRSMTQVLQVADFKQIAVRPMLPYFGGLFGVVLGFVWKLFSIAPNVLLGNRRADYLISNNIFVSAVK